MEGCRYNNINNLFGIFCQLQKSIFPIKCHCINICSIKIKKWMLCNCRLEVRPAKLVNLRYYWRVEMDLQNITESSSESILYNPDFIAIIGKAVSINYWFLFLLWICFQAAWSVSGEELPCWDFSLCWSWWLKTISSTIFIEKNLMNNLP